jgi:dihydroneopterin aldolase
MGDKLFLEDVRFYGQHGLTPAEQVVGAWFSVSDDGCSRSCLTVARS